MKVYLGKTEYFYGKINNISLPEIFHNLINRGLYIFDEKIYDTEGITPTRNKSFLNYNLVISEIFNLLKRGDLSSLIPKLKVKVNVCWNKIRAMLQDKYQVNKSKSYACVSAEDSVSSY